jgi:ABC-type nitrate/sulfonate/bicarbonate transport system substrate-binding protein
VSTSKSQAIDRLWFTRCPVPTATGLAHKLGWLESEFAADGIALSTLQDHRELARHHYDHQVPTLIREGGNLLAIAARAQGAPTRLIGLTWIDEWQTILVRPDSGITEPAHLKGLRLALPAFIDHPLPAHIRGSSIARGMSLQGYRGALKIAGLTLDDVELVEVGSGQGGREDLGGLWDGIAQLAAGKVDAVYVKGASALEAAAKQGVVFGINLDTYPDLQYRVNNGTPRPITVHEQLLQEQPELVARFLYQSLRASEWAKTNLEGVRKVLEGETRSGGIGVQQAYGDQFHLSLAPDLSDERLHLFRQQKHFMLVHGLLDRDFDLDAWVERGPLETALAWLQDERKAA